MFFSPLLNKDIGVREMPGLFFKENLGFLGQSCYWYIGCLYANYRKTTLGQTAASHSPLGLGREPDLFE